MQQASRITQTTRSWAGFAPVVLALAVGLLVTLGGGRELLAQAPQPGGGGFEAHLDLRQSPALQDQDGAETGRAPTRSPRGYDFETERLRRQIADCDGYQCVLLRNRLVARMNDRLAKCGPSECRELRQELRVERRQRNCLRSGMVCDDPRVR